jgi:hypothetical protein
MAMIQWLKELDDVLRGHKADPRLLAEGTGHIQITPLVGVSVMLGIIYGVFMGLYAVLGRTTPSYEQLIASAIKVPALFFLTLVVTFPSLYVFSALLGVRLGPKDTFRLILAPIAVNLAVLASLGPITGFFTLSTSNYHFMKLLNFVFFAIAGVIGLKVLLGMLSRLEDAQTPPPSRAEDNAGSSGTGTPGQFIAAHSVVLSLNREKSSARTTFQIWLVIYALVGAQMGWILRPFIGAPGLPFEVFRTREANIFVDMVTTIGKLLGQ